MMNNKWQSEPMRDVAKYTKQQVEKTEKLAREYGEKVKDNPTHTIAKTFAIHPGHMNPIFRPKWNQFFHLVSVRCGEKLIS